LYIFYNGYPLNVLGAAVIRGRVAYEVEEGTPGAFKHCGAWYVWDRAGK
jgi:hypothetical protein